MIPKVVEVKYVKEFSIWIRFADGNEGEIDFRDELEGEIFQPLKDKEYFQKVILHPELHTLTWPNGADFAPEFLYDKTKILA